MVTTGGLKKTISQKEFEQCETVAQNELDIIIPNMIDLESFSEGIILHQCRARYQKDQIYTFVGTILVAVNPFRSLDIYNDKEITKHKQMARGTEAPEPHVFAISALALEHLISDRASQSVLISGESGAGKTETTKKILEYLAAVAGKDERRSSTTNVAQQILQVSKGDRRGFFMAHMCVYMLTLASLVVQPHPRVVRQRQDGAQQQLVPLREVDGAELHQRGKDQGLPDRELPP